MIFIDIYSAPLFRTAAVLYQQKQQCKQEIAIGIQHAAAILPGSILERIRKRRYVLPTATFWKPLPYWPVEWWSTDAKQSSANYVDRRRQQRHLPNAAGKSRCDRQFTVTATSAPASGASLLPLQHHSMTSGISRL